MNVYADSERRYYNDPEFKALVDWLTHFALEKGYTPGELKQVAFYAALRVEMYAKQIKTLYPDDKP